MVSSKCCQVESPSPFRFLAALMPPWAQTECERFTGTIENRSTSPPNSAILMTAARPARPPPTTMILGAAMLYKSDLPGPQGLKPASILLQGGTAEAAPFPFVLERVSQRITIFSEVFEFKGCCGRLKKPYMLSAPIAINPSAKARQT